MKRIAFLSSLLCLTMIVSAQVISGTSQITLSSSAQADKFVRLIISSSFSDAFDNAYDSEAANDGGIYVFHNDTRYTIWASNAYSDNLAIGFKACENTSYTLSFSNFTGSGYKLYDLVAGETIDVNGSTPDYVFTITEGEKNTTINNRFVINYVPAGFEICFRDNELQITSNPYAENVVVKDENGTRVVDEAPVTPYQAINLSALAAGRYTVELAGGARKFVVVKQ